MSDQRRTSILKEVEDALQGTATPFPHERITATIVRTDREFSELVGVIAVDHHATFLWRGHSEGKLRSLLTRAVEELRLIEAKDSGAVYDVGLRAEMRMALQSTDTAQADNAKGPDHG